MDLLWVEWDEESKKKLFKPLFLGFLCMCFFGDFRDFVILRFCDGRLVWVLDLRMGRSKVEWSGEMRGHARGREVGIGSCVLLWGMHFI